MPLQRFRIFLAARREFETELDTALPIDQIVLQLANYCRLPSVTSAGEQISYGLFTSAGQMLGPAQTLQQAGYAIGGELWLANQRAPWWVSSAQPAAPSAPRRSGLPLILLGVGATLLTLLCVGGVGITLFLQRPDARPTEAATAVAREEQQSPVPTATRRLTATARPEPTQSPSATQRSATASPAPTVAADTPTATIAATATSAPPSFTPTVAALRTVRSQGILRAYRNREARLFFNDKSGFGAFLWQEPELQETIPATRGNVVISNDDTLDILDEGVPGLYRVRVVSNKLDPADPQVLGVEGWIARWLVDNQNVPTPRPTLPVPTTDLRRLRFQLINTNDDPACISVRITGINAAGWNFSVDGINLAGRFDGAGNARLCGLAPSQEVTITVKNTRGQRVPGGGGVPTRGGAIMQADWR